MKFKHNLPFTIWILATLMIAVLLALAWLFLSQGPLAEPVLNITIAIGLLTIATIAGSAAYSKPCVALSLGNDELQLSLRYPLTTQRLNYHREQIKSVRLVESKDSEGDPHFVTKITFTDNREIDLAEGSREICEPVLAELTSALSILSEANND